jgi:hypothetical protein
VADAMGELFEPDRWVSVVGITGAGMRPLYDVEETARSGNALMVKATRV